MTCWQAMNKLENMGYTFIKDGESLKAAIIGKAPPEASKLLDIVRADREAAADYIRQRDAGATVTDDGCTYSVFDALAIGQAVRRGAAVLLAPVIFHKQALTVTVYWHPVDADSGTVLETIKNRLISTMKARMQELEDKPLDGLTDGEIDQFCEKYSLYKTIMEECQ